MYFYFYFMKLRDKGDQVYLHLVPTFCTSNLLQTSSLTARNILTYCHITVAYKIYCVGNTTIVSCV